MPRLWSCANFSEAAIVSIRRFVLLSLLAIVCVACGGDPPKPTWPSGGTYIVKKGDTLYSIAWRNGVDYRELAQWNGIGRDFAIKPGQVLKLSPNSKVARESAPAARAPNPTPTPGLGDATRLNWQWPVKSGTSQLTTRPNGGKGLMIAGTLGQEIRAAAGGRVVYAGTGLLGYGQLLIIQHNDALLSAYGHTQALRVREQQQVTPGQVVATMGAGPNGSPMLYFEIRVNGRPVDPTPLLPK